MTKQIASALLALCVLSSAVGQEVDEPRDATPVLRSVFLDTLESDSKANYILEGDVTWSPGSFTLAPGASITRTIAGSAWTVADLRCLPVIANGRESRCRVRLALDRATDCLVEMVSRSGSQGTTLAITLFDTDGSAAKQVATSNLISHQNSSGEVDLKLEYRHGLVRVSYGGEQVMIGYLKNGNATVESISVIAASGETSVKRLGSSTVPKAERAYTPQQTQRLEKAKQDLANVNRLNRSGRFRDAVALAASVVRTRTELLDSHHPDIASSLSGLAYLLHRTGNLRDAKRLYEQTLSLRKAIVGEEHPDYTNTLDNFGMLLHTIGDLEEATKLCEAAREARATVLGEMHPAFGSSLNNLSLIYQSQGQFDRAEKVLRRSLKIKEERPGTQSLSYATSLGNLAELYRRMHDAKQAEPLYNKAMEIIREVAGEQHPAYVGNLNNLALMHMSSGDYAKAEPLQRRTIELAKATLGEGHPSYAQAQNNLAELYRKMGDYDRAEPLMQLALNAKKDAFSEHHPSYANSLSNLALLYYNQGSYSRAVPFFEQAIAINRQVLGRTNPQYATTLNNLAGALEELGNLSRAEQLYEEAREIRLKTLGDQSPLYLASLNNLAGLALKQGKLTRAEDLYEKILDQLKESLGEQHPYYAKSLLGRAVVKEAFGDYTGAAPMYAEAESLERNRLEQNAVVLSARQQYRQLLSKRVFLDARISLAVENGTSNINDLAADLWSWKGSITARQRAYRQIANVPELNTLFAALRSITQQLSAATSRFPYAPPSSAPQAARDQFQRKRLRSVQLIERLTQEREELESKIASESGAYRRANTPVQVSDIQSVLPKDAAFVDFILYTHHSLTDLGIEYERRYAALVVPQSGAVHLVGLGPADSIDSSIDDFRKPLAGQVMEDPLAPAQLRKQLWAPLERSFKSITTVILSPDGALGRLPFAALPGRTPGTYLIEEYRIASVPSARMLHDLKNKTEPPGGFQLSVVGDIDFDQSSSPSATQTSRLAANQTTETPLRAGDANDTQWKSLPGFIQESQMVVSLFRQRFGKDAAVETLTGSRATEAELLTLARRSGILHIVTHGFFAGPSVPSIEQAVVASELVEDSKTGPDPLFNRWMPGLLSGLVMAGANQQTANLDNFDDGILRASEIEASRLPDIDLVVLSACETGLGPVAGGEGLTGLHRAFHVAGAQSVIASLWKVDDAATQELMRRFYTNRWIERQSKLDALRNAQLWVLRNPGGIADLGIRDAETRGAVRDRRKPLANDRKGEMTKTSPFFWASFQLSGQW
ncbi:MAG: CHAT domain-containing tetratricopeptide repeat protein [Planctomycetota bacterium]